MSNLLLISAISGLFILIIAAHRKYFGNKYQSKMYYIVWLVLILRLAIPIDFSLESSYNPSVEIRPIENIVNNEIVGTVFNTENQDVNVNNSNIVTTPKDNIVMPAENTIKQLSLKEVFIRNINSIWILGVVATLMFNIYAYFDFKKKIINSSYEADIQIISRFEQIKGNRNIGENVSLLQSQEARSPFLMGLIKPIIVLPENIKTDDIDYVLYHELTHYKRKDIGYKYLLVFAKSIHWFNPLVYLMGRYVSEDIELSCDYEVAKLMDSDEKYNYSASILGVVESSLNSKTPAMLVNYTGGINFMKKRIDNILSQNKKKRSKFIFLAVVLIVLSGLFVGCEKELSIEELLAEIDRKEDENGTYYTQWTWQVLNGTETLHYGSGEQWYENNSGDFRSIGKLVYDGYETQTYSDNNSFSTYSQIGKEVSIYGLEPSANDDESLARAKKIHSDHMTIKERLSDGLNKASENWEIVLNGTEKLIGRDSYYVSLKHKKNPELYGAYDLWIDADTWAVLKYEYRLAKKVETRTVNEYIIGEEFDDSTFELKYDPSEVEVKYY
ncbi:MAG: hypothetical protein GXZ08_00660 [Tissierellia bacterium]|nr:hypothetical protein [Tissierellia bacterium]